jgi:predicted GNAT family acetyltransferase
MRIELLTSAEEFLTRTLTFRAADPFRTNILGGVATAVADGSLTYDAHLWWVLLNDQDQNVGAAMRTAPHGMVLSPMPLNAICDLACAVSRQDDELPSVSGPTAVVEKFIEEYQRTLSKGSTRKATLEEQLLLYALENLSIPPVNGVMTIASASDYELLLKWYIEFGKDTGVFMPNPQGSIRAGLSRNSYRFWSIDDEKVCLAGYAPLVSTSTGTIARIGPVYTPPERRRNGYGGALTAALTQELLSQGAKVMLYTDALNPTSNSIYQKIGYKFSADSA